MDELKRLAKISFVQLVGLLLGCLAFLSLIPRIVKRGLWATVTTKERPLPPAILNDERWGEHKYVHVPGVKLHYVEKGDRSKPLMVMVHGFPEFWFSWRHQLEHFSKVCFDYCVDAYNWLIMLSSVRITGVLPWTTGVMETVTSPTELKTMHLALLQLTSRT